jgi:hypothetical protein
MPQRFTIEERALCACWYHETKSVITVQRRFKEQERKKGKTNNIAPGRNCILLWYSSLFSNGSIQDKKRHRPKRVGTDELCNAVTGAILSNPHISLRRLSNIFSIPLTTAHNIVHKFRFHPYKLQTVHKLNDSDLLLRLAFCHEEASRISGDPQHLIHLLHTDEANFHLSGAVNKHNFRYWSDTNPHWVTEEPLHSPKVIVWAGVSVNHIIGPFFFSDTVTGERYQAMLQNWFLPQFSRTQRRSIRFMHDGAPPHWSRPVRVWLTDNFPNHWMGRGSPNMPWPPRSPDLSMCDFFLWGYVKSVVYRQKLHSIEELKMAIAQAFQSVTPEMRQKAALDYRRRLQQCIRMNGGHVEMEVVTKF